MISLAVKYRPQSFEEVVEQDVVKQVLLNQIKTNQIYNSYLFVGQAGSGKTTSARLFAKLLNGDGYVVEIDAASNNGVDAMRQLIEECKQQPIGQKYRIYIIDECFTGDTLITTVNGEKPIKDIKVGDTVSTLEGNRRVLSTHKKTVKTSDLIKVCLKNGSSIVCTKDHLFFTTEGWIKACDLASGVELINYENLSNLWEGIQYNKCDMQPRLWSSKCLEKEKASIPTKNVFTQMHNLRKGLGNNPHQFSTNMFQRVLFQAFNNTTEGDIQYSKGFNTKTRVFRKSKENSWIWNSNTRSQKKNLYTNDIKQSVKECSGYRKDEANKRKEWNSTCVEGEEGGKWQLYKRTTPSKRLIGEGLGYGICSSNKDEKRNRLSYKLQIRPSLTFKKSWGRGGWQRALTERKAVTGYKKANFSRRYWVDHIEIYQSTDSRGTFNSSENYTEVFDLTVEGSPTYFANGMLVHNCHSLSNQAWQSLLKLIEEPPERSILIFCTTDSSKIPDTIISRVQQFYFYKISPKGIYERLKFISENEQIKISDDALKYIAMYAEGGLRNAITLLEKCHYYKNDLSLEDVCNVIGCASYDLLFGIIQSIFNKEIDKVIDFINQSEEYGVGFYQLFLQIYRLLLDIQKYSIINDFSYTNIPDLYEEDIKDIIRLDNGLSLKLIRELKEVFTIRNINCQKDLFIAVILGLE